MLMRRLIRGWELENPAPLSITVGGASIILEEIRKSAALTHVLQDILKAK